MAVLFALSEEQADTQRGAFGLIALGAVLGFMAYRSLGAGNFARLAGMAVFAAIAAPMVGVLMNLGATP